MRLKFAFLFLGVLLSAGVVAAQTINTVANGGPNNVAAAAANVALPWSLATDRAGDLFIADCQNDRVFKVNSSAQLTVVAGTGFAGYTGDGGPATLATLNLVCAFGSTGSTSGVAVDGPGNLFIADNVNNVIRKVDTTGTITTVAGGGVCSTFCTGDGGPATKAILGGPSGVAADSAGNLFIAATFNCLVRRVDAVSQIIASVAGSLVANGKALNCGFGSDGGPATSAQLNAPVAVAVDGSGELFIIDLF